MRSLSAPNEWSVCNQLRRRASPASLVLAARLRVIIPIPVYDVEPLDKDRRPFLNTKVGGQESGRWPRQHRRAVVDNARTTLG
jgi:hypothetical protein